MEQILHQEGGYKYWETSRLHKSEKRRFLEGVVQRNRIEQEQADRERGEDPAVAERRREIEAGQEAARQDLLDDINANAAGDGQPAV